MGILSKLFGKKEDNTKVGGMEDYMNLVRVYFQASIASNLGITNLAMLPDLRVFKTTLHVPTLNNKLGLGEKKHCAKMLTQMYGTDESFFKEIDASIRKNCRKPQDVQTYMIQFQGFTQDLMMLMGNLMKFKLRLRDKDRAGYPSVRQAFGILAEMDYRLRLSGSDARKERAETG